MPCSTLWYSFVFPPPTNQFSEGKVPTTKEDPQDPDSSSSSLTSLEEEKDVKGDGAPAMKLTIKKGDKQKKRREDDSKRATVSNTEDFLKYIIATGFWHALSCMHPWGMLYLSFHLPHAGRKQSSAEAEALHISLRCKAELQKAVWGLWQHSLQGVCSEEGTGGSRHRRLVDKEFLMFFVVNGRAVVKTTFVESETSPSPGLGDWIKKESKEVRGQDGVKMRETGQRQKKRILFETTYFNFFYFCVIL